MEYKNKLFSLLCTVSITFSDGMDRERLTEIKQAGLTIQKREIAIKDDKNIKIVQSDELEALIRWNIPFDILSFNQLSHITLSSCEIYHDEMEKLSHFLSSNPILTSMNLIRNDIGENELVILGKSLKINSRLEHLQISENPIGAAGAESIRDILKSKNTSLKSIYLTKCTEINKKWKHYEGTFDKQAELIAEGLITNTSLKTLSLDRNNIKNDGARSLSEALKRNETLTYLDLSHCEFGATGAKHVAEGLKMNRTLEFLNLNVRKLLWSGIPNELIEATRHHPTLKKLIVGDSFSDRKGNVTFVDDIKINDQCVVVGLPQQYK